MSEQSLPLLSANQIAAVSAPLENAFTLPRHAYTSEQIYNSEKENIFASCWTPVARVDQLKEVGSFICTELNDQPLLVIRGEDDVIRVMSNVCLHRSALLAKGEGAQLKFSCPYHAWTYDTTGQLIAVPMMEGVDNFEKKECRLPQLQVEIWQGFVMANLDNSASAFAPQVMSYSAFFDNFQIQNQVIVKTLEFDSDWNWKVLVENFMEAYHHIATHSDTLQPEYPARDSYAEDSNGPWAILQMPGKESHEGPILPIVEGLTELQQRSLYAGVIFPHFLMVVQGDLVLWYQVIPRSSGKLLLRIHLCIHQDNLGMPGLDEIVTGTAEMVNLVHNEDIAVNDLVWLGLNAPLSEQGRLSSYEKPIWQLNQWWLEKMGFIEANAKPLVIST